MTIACDVHTHLVPTANLGDRCPGVSWDPAGEVLTIDGHRLGLKALFRPGELLDWLERHAIAHAFISVPPPAYRAHLPEQEAAAWVAFLNDGLAEIAAGSGGRLTMLRHLPVEHPQLAAAIAAQPDGGSGFAMASGQAAGQGLSDAAYDTLWRALGRAFLLIHPGESPDARLTPFYLGNLLGNPVETALAAANLVLGGVLQRFPDLQICLAHAGGVTPIIAGRLQRGYDTARPGIDCALPPPAVLLRRLWVDCIAHDPGALAMAAAVHGEEHILFGSDWPFPMGLPEPQAQLASAPPERLAGLFARKPPGAGR